MILYVLKLSQLAGCVSVLKQRDAIEGESLKNILHKRQKKKKTIRVNLAGELRFSLCLQEKSVLSTCEEISSLC